MQEVGEEVDHRLVEEVEDRHHPLEQRVELLLQEEVQLDEQQGLELVKLLERLEEVQHEQGKVELREHLG